MAPLARCGMLSPVIPSVAERGGKMIDAAKVGVISVGLGSEQGMKRMMKIVAPLCRYCVSAFIMRPQEFGIVQITLGDQVQGAASNRVPAASTASCSSARM